MKHFADSEGNASGKNGNEITSGAHQPTAPSSVISNHQSNSGFSDRLTRCFVTSSHCCQTPKSPRDQQEECYENGASASAGASYLKPTSLIQGLWICFVFFWFGFDRDRNMDAKVGLKVVLESWDVEIFDITPYLLSNLNCIFMTEIKTSKASPETLYLYFTIGNVCFGHSHQSILTYSRPTMYTAFDLPIIDFLTIWACNILFVPE